jgi:hypothetical protein
VPQDPAGAHSAARRLGARGKRVAVPPPEQIFMAVRFYKVEHPDFFIFTDFCFLSLKKILFLLFPRIYFFISSKNIDLE